MQCCNRIQAQITHERGRVAGLARRASLASERGRDISGYMAEINDAQANLKEHRARLVRHQAEAHSPKISVGA